MLIPNGVMLRTISGTLDEEYANSDTISGIYDGYVTDHTDLGSDIDESEYRRELLKDVSNNLIS